MTDHDARPALYPENVPPRSATLPFLYTAWIALAAAQSKAGRRTESSRALGEALRIRPRLRVEEAHPWIGPRMAARLSEVWPSRPEPDPRAPRAGPRPDAGR